MGIHLTTKITESNIQDLDEDAKIRVETIKQVLIRKGDETEVARTKGKKGNILLDAYLESLSAYGLDLKSYRAKILYRGNDNYYKLIIERL